MLNRLRHIRESKDLTLEVVAERMHMTPMSLSRVERGKTRLKIADVPKFAKALGVEWHEILGELPFLTPEELELIETFRELPADRKPNARSVLKALNPQSPTPGSEAAD